MPALRRASEARNLVAFGCLAFAAAALAVPESAAREGDPAPAMTAAAIAFLGGLGEARRAEAQLPFDSENRLDWHYVPRSRRGVALKEMSVEQRRLAFELLRSGLSGSGFAKVEKIRGLEEILFALEGRPIRDTGLYHFTIFGAPAATGAWGWRFEGHHASLHWTIVDGRVAGSAPQFLGANPADVRDGPRRGARALAAEEDLGRTLIQALDAGRRQRAVVSPRAPADIASGSSRDLAPREPSGIAWSDLDPTQQEILLSLVGEYAAVQTPAVAESRLARVRAALADVRFAWMGGTEKGEGHYYRIDGPDFLIEYDNTQDGANHIHCVWRDRRHDWGRDLLAEHYRDAPHHAAEREAASDAGRGAP